MPKRSQNIFRKTAWIGCVSSGELCVSDQWNPAKPYAPSALTHRSLVVTWRQFSSSQSLAQGTKPQEESNEITNATELLGSMPT